MLPEGWTVYRSGVLGLILTYGEPKSDEYDKEVCWLNDSGLHFHRGFDGRSIPLECLNFLLEAYQESKNRTR